MKHLPILAVLLLLVGGCRKGMEDRNNGFYNYISTVLRDSLSSSDFAAVQMQAIHQSHLSGDTSLFVVPSKRSSGEFWAFLLANERPVRSAVHVQLVYDEQRPAPAYSLTGWIKVSWLNGEQQWSSIMRDGYIERRQPQQKGSVTKGLSKVVPVHPPDYKTLPEVVVVGTRSGGGGGGGVMSYSTWMSIGTVFQSGSSTDYAYVGQGYGAGEDGGAYNGPVIRIDRELAGYNPAIDLEAYFSCFNKLPNEGAVCSIAILTDIPVDDDPNKLLHWRTASPGHTFLQIRKSVGGVTVLQNIGFYPEAGFKVSLTNAPVKGKFVDNGRHEFNASLSMDLQPAELRLILNKIAPLSSEAYYDIDEFNCTDFALDVFNLVRRNRLEIPKYDIPGGITADGTSTPQGLYNKLVAMKAAGDPEGGRISLPRIKTSVSASTGPCK